MHIPIDNECAPRTVEETARDLQLALGHAMGPCEGMTWEELTPDGHAPWMDAARRYLGVRRASPGHLLADAHLATLLSQTAAFYTMLVGHGMNPGVATNAIRPIETAARNLHGIASLATGADDGWRPISTAPRDGDPHHGDRDIDLWHRQHGRMANCFWRTPTGPDDPVRKAYWFKRTGGRSSNAGDDADFTHWRPRPAPPQA